MGSRPFLPSFLPSFLLSFLLIARHIVSFYSLPIIFIPLLRYENTYSKLRYDTIRHATSRYDTLLYSTLHYTTSIRSNRAKNQIRGIT